MGGVETHCEELLPRIARLAPELSLHVLGRAPYMAESETSVGDVSVTALPSPRRQSLEAIVSTMIGIWHARRHRADLVHIHAVGPALTVPFARLLGLRTVVTHHGADYDRAKWGRFAKTMLRLGERAGMSARQIIAVSPSLKDMLEKRYPKASPRLSYIPNGAPALAEDARARKEVLRSVGVEAGKFVLTVGRLVPEKAFDDLVAAHAISGDTRALLIVGAADHASPFASRLLKKASERVIFAGLQPRSVLAHLYASCDLFVLPSRHEGLPIVALEAAKAGANMLLSDIPANLDVGLDADNYYPVGERDALAAALSQPGHAYPVDADAISRRFDWDRIATETAAVYRRALG